MKKKYLILILLPFLGLVLSGSINKSSSNEYNIKNFYLANSPKKIGTKVLTNFGNIEDVNFILEPTNIEVGKYKVNITKKGSNIYKIESSDIWIETQYCYEFASWEDVILIVESNYGFTKGKIIFN